VEVNYKLPYEESYQFEQNGGKSLLSGTLSGTPEVTVIAPLDVVTLAGTNLTLTKQEPKQGAAYYAWNSPQPLKFSISGVLPDNGGPEAGGAPSQAGSAGGEGDANASEALSTVENQNFVFQARWKILIVLAAALVFGLINLYRQSAVAQVTGKQKAPAPQPALAKK
jgi:hypothetical protein